MEKIVSVIPNFCNGTDKELIDEISEKLKNIKDLVLMDVSMDSTRNRTVFAFSGTEDAIFKGGIFLYERALKDIDMRSHKGEYPRIGALDVFPFVPLKDTPIEECVVISEKFAKEVAEKFNIPVYLFAESAKLSVRRDLENIRDCEYEGIEVRLKNPSWKPDFGPDIFNADFGATIIGARYPLVSFKVNLDSKDLKKAKSICRDVQYSSGGLRYVKAYAGLIRETGFTEITISISNFTSTPPFKVIEMIKVMSKRFSVNITDIEMIGLIPERVFIDAAQFYMQIKDFKDERILEKSLKDHFTCL